MSRILSCAAFLLAGFASSAAVAQYPPPPPSTAQMGPTSFNTAMMGNQVTISFKSKILLVGIGQTGQGLTQIEQKLGDGSWAALTASVRAGVQVAPQVAQGNLETNKTPMALGTYSLRQAVYVNGKLAGNSKEVVIIVGATETAQVGDSGQWSITYVP